jgi:replicative DNA helicase
MFFPCDRFVRIPLAVPSPPDADRSLFSSIRGEKGGLPPMPDQKPQLRLASSTTDPNSGGTERTVLGCLIIDTNLASEYAYVLVPDDFHDPLYRSVFMGIRESIEKNRVVDFVLLCETLSENDAVSRVGGSAFIASLAEGVPTSSHLPQYVNILKTRRAEREIIAIGKRIEKRGHESGTAGSVPATLLEESRRLSELLPTAGGMDRAGILQELTTDQQTIPTGFPNMDIILGGGLSPGDLFLIASRPSVGKSSLATSLAAAFLRKDVKPCFFSLEMSRKQIVTRILCAYHKVTPIQAKTRAKELLDGVKTDIDIYIGTNDISQIVQTTFSTDAKVIIIDYLGLITAPNVKDGRFAAMDEISRSVKLLAVHTGKPVVLLTQLNREIEKVKENREPYLSDLFGSGERDADIVSFLWDPAAKREHEKKTVGSAAHTAGALDGSLRAGTHVSPAERRPLKWLVRKNRNGPTGDVELFFEQSMFLMEEGVHPDSSLPTPQDPPKKPKKLPF